MRRPIKANVNYSSSYYVHSERVCTSVFLFRSFRFCAADDDIVGRARFKLNAESFRSVFSSFEISKAGEFDATLRIKKKNQNRRFRLTRNYAKKRVRDERRVPDYEFRACGRYVRVYRRYFIQFGFP